MVTRFLLPLLSFLGLAFAVFTVVQARQAPPTAEPIITPPTGPEFRAIAGAGLIESRLENIPVGTTVPGVVSEVFVQVDEPYGTETKPSVVKAGDALFRLDDRAARAELSVRRATLRAAMAELGKLKAAPRPEDLPPAEAAVAQAQAGVKDAETRFNRTLQLRGRNAITDSEYDRDRYALEAARATLNKATADLDRLHSGTWTEEIAMAEARVAEAQALVEAAETGLEILTVRAQADGKVLQVNVRPGQFAALAWKEPLIILGDLSRLHVRVDIDEQDVPYFRPGARAVATLKGRPNVRFDLEPVRVEPYVIPKRSLTGDNSERVDTRVLQVVYALPLSSPIPLYVGQQMDVYLEAALAPEGVALETSGEDAVAGSAASILDGPIDSATP